MSQLQDIRKRHGARRSAMQTTMQNLTAVRREYREMMRDMGVLLGMVYAVDGRKRRARPPSDHVEGGEGGEAP